MGLARVRHRDHRTSILVRIVRLISIGPVIVYESIILRRVFLTRRETGTRRGLWLVRTPDSRLDAGSCSLSLLRDRVACIDPVCVHIDGLGQVYTSSAMLCLPSSSSLGAYSWFRSGSSVRMTCSSSFQLLASYRS